LVSISQNRVVCLMVEDISICFVIVEQTEGWVLLLCDSGEIVTPSYVSLFVYLVCLWNSTWHIVENPNWNVSTYRLILHKS